MFCSYVGVFVAEKVFSGSQCRFVFVDARFYFSVFIELSVDYGAKVFEVVKELDVLVVRKGDVWGQGVIGRSFIGLLQGDQEECGFSF